MRKEARRCLELLLYAGAGLGGGWLLMRFALPALSPFLLAYVFSAATEPAVRALTRLRLRRGAAAALVTLALLGLLLFLSARLTARGIEALNDLAASLPELLSAMETKLSQGERWLLERTREIPGGAEYLEIALDAVSGALTNIPAGLSRRLLEAAKTAAQRSPDVLLFLVTSALGGVFLSANYPTVREFLRAQIPVSWLRHLDALSQDLRQSFGGWLRAQALLMLITFAELLTALLILRVPGAGWIAALTAVVDALPVFGVGAVLVPWAAVALLRGSTRLGFGLLLAFAVISLMRDLLQAKLLGDQIGLEPLPSLLAVYVGWKLCGVWGLLFFPLLLVTLCQLNDRGLLRLWKKP